MLSWGQIEEFPIAVPFQEYRKSLHEAISLAGIVAGDVLEVGAPEDQTAGAALAFGGGNAGLGAPDLAFEGVLPEALGIRRARAALNPAMVRSRINSRSNSASPAKMPNTRRPAAVVVSICAP